MALLKFFPRSVECKLAVYRLVTVVRWQRSSGDLQTTVYDGYHGVHFLLDSYLEQKTETTEYFGGFRCLVHEYWKMMINTRSQSFHFPCDQELYYHGKKFCCGHSRSAWGLAFLIQATCNGFRAPCTLAAARVKPYYGVKGFNRKSSTTFMSVDVKKNPLSQRSLVCPKPHPGWGIYGDTS